jgi:hypothetical protein
MEEYEEKRGEDSIRRRANHGVETVLEEIEEMNREVSKGSAL